MKEKQQSDVGLEELYDNTLETLHELSKVIRKGAKCQVHVDKLVKQYMKLIEKTFSEYDFEFFVSKDYFQGFVEVYNLLNKNHAEYIWRFFQLSQLIVSNIKGSDDLNRLFNLQGFRLFFSLKYDFHSNDEIVDYFINIIKSIVLKMNEETDFDAVKELIQKVLELSNHKDNLVKTTVRNIMLSLLRLENKACKKYLTEFPFLYYLVDIIRGINRKVVELDEHILNDKSSALKEEILNLQDSLQFIEEIIQCCSTEELKSIVRNSFICGVVFQIILPVFRSDIQVNNPNMNGINTILFLLNNILAIMHKSGIKDLIVNNIIFNDGINRKNKDVFDYGLFHLSGYDKLESSKLVVSFKDMKLFVENGGKSYQTFTRTLIAFLKSKDDNMLLLTVSIFLFILEDGGYDLSNLGMDQLIEKALELIEQDPSFRLITSKFTAKLIYLCFQKYKGGNAILRDRVARIFKVKTTNIIKAFRVESLREILVSKFRKIVFSIDSEDVWENIKPVPLNWLSIYNYTFNQNKNKDLRYLDLGYKHDLNDEEYIETEIFVFVLLKQLRYLLIPESLLMDFEKDFKTAYKTHFIKSGLENEDDKIKYKPGTTVMINFTDDVSIKRLFSGFSTGSNKAVLLMAILDQDLIMLEELNKQSGLYKIVFKENYSNIVYYFDRSNPRQLNFSSKSVVKFWGFLFNNNQWCIKGKNYLDDIFEELVNSESKFLFELLKRYQADNV